MLKHAVVRLFLFVCVSKRVTGIVRYLWIYMLTKDSVGDLTE